MEKAGRRQKAASSEMRLRWRGRLWLEGPEGTFLGFGRVVLLERIREHGSLAGAARSMEMSYKHAWDLLASMTRQAGCPLVAATRGGKGGGGAVLTPAGEKAVALFRSYHERFQQELVAMSGELKELLCEGEQSKIKRGKS